MTDKLYGGLSAEAMLAIAPSWATHVATHDDHPNTFIFESADKYVAFVDNQLLCVCEQEPKGMQPDAELLATIINQLKKVTH